VGSKDLKVTDMRPQKELEPLKLEYLYRASAISVYDAWITKPVQYG